MRGILVTVLFFAWTVQSFGQKPEYERMANTAMDKVVVESKFATNKGLKWTYDLGVPLEGLLEVWRTTANGDYFNFVKTWMDKYVDKEGNILNYSAEEYNIDHVKNGKVLIALFKATGDKRYLNACHHLFAQMKTHPRTNEGGFWHKKVYPYQMWLDGLYMAQPFLTEYATLLDKKELYDDIVNQFVWMEKNARDPKTGLLYHGWDESREQRWANPQTGHSPHFWGRGMGWFVFALVDVLEYFPEDHVGHQKIVGILQRTMDAIAKYQDPKTGVWYDVVDLGHREKNYHEASASSMYTYAMIKGVRRGYLGKKFIPNIEKARAGLHKEFVEDVSATHINLKKNVAVSGLGGAKKYRDGSFEYYMSEPVISNDPKGVGPFMLVEIEYEKLKKAQAIGKSPLVTLDNYYNNEYKEFVPGLKKSYHYLWDGQDFNGFHILGSIFDGYGAKLSTLRDAPTTKNLNDTDIYIIVDPDNAKDAEAPNYMNPKEAQAVANWVKKGGVLVLLLNDKGNCDLDKINLLSSKFGITFNDDSRNRVQGRNFEQGALLLQPNEIFKKTSKLYLKEISTINVAKPATALVQDAGDVIMATAKYGKGTVFALGDPWLYNEYVDGRKLPNDFQNFSAANELVEWLIKQVK
ncbi:glycoside hydrolase family 88 protein [Sphingobacterium bovistauri]|uniref:Glycoside hydrolase family 88 protein n=1 Tax=Sphingobacterium bovistauri TaxID=2781959 RepID=A0ABS7Z1G0_9SPHI|nr:glycoside hydrolase family 88 protein [Sphingobacterium bovistauri]MCA5004009.1 glycoside hydrolase family 88 protein [Sphingobacterium bovistauri]